MISPCRTCELKDKDKDNETCYSCVDRVEYCLSLDPEKLTPNNSPIDRLYAKNTEDQAHLIDDIRYEATQNVSPWPLETVMDTSNKNRFTTARLRRQAIAHICRLFPDARSDTIAEALGISTSPIWRVRRGA